MSLGLAMVLKAESKMLKSPNANTQYLTIPANMTIDSQYPFKPNDKVELEIDGTKQVLIVRRSTKKA
jgi:hypothetical protein